MATVSTVPTRTGKFLRIAGNGYKVELHLTNEECREVVSALTGEAPWQPRVDYQEVTDEPS